MKNNKTKGYTLLFSVLTAVLVLGVAAFVIGVARKQYILSSTARDSLYAFYAADTAIECTAEGNVSSIDPVATPNVSLSCNGSTISNINFYKVANASDIPTGFNSAVDVYLASFVIPLHFSNPNPAILQPDGCAYMKVWRGVDTNNVPMTQIESRGYSQCDTNFSTKVTTYSVNPRTVERAILLTQ